MPKLLIVDDEVEIRAFEEFDLLVLPKPFSLEHLEEAVATAVAKTRWAREGSTGPDA